MSERKKMTWRQWVRWNAVLKQRQQRISNAASRQRQNEKIQELDARLVVLRAVQESLQ